MKLRALILFFIISICACSAEPTQIVAQPTAAPPITQPQNISYEACTKMFPVNKEKLFYFTLGSVNANRFTIEEIQTQRGYVIFTAVNNRYLATIAGIDATNSILKITPCNDIYIFPPGVLLGMYKYIELNINTEIK